MAESQLPLVSIIMPAFNHEAYVEQAVRSVMAQTHPSVELVVIDDFSSDRTADIAERLSVELEFSFIRNERNLGLNPTFQKGIDQSRGAYIAMIASDDIILPEKVERQVCWLEDSGDDAVYSSGYLYFEDGRREPIDLHVTDADFRNGKMLRRTYVDDTHAPLIQSGLFRRDVMIELMQHRQRFKSDDWVMLIKLLENNRVGYLDERLFLYRQHQENTFRKYWTTLPMRVDVIAHATPEHLRAEALGNVLASQAQYLRADGKRALAAKLQRASIAINPDARRFAKYLNARLRAAGHRVGRLLRR